jgi:predicted enzyme related to lactoylglutathione lyase
MSTKKRKKKDPAAGLVWFEIPADNPKRATAFFSAMFGWKITPFPHMPEYSHIDTGGADTSPDGGLLKRMHPGHTITAYFLVPSVARAMAKIKRLRGKVCKPKTAVPGMGYFAIGLDTEKNAFAVWEVNPKAR